MEKNIFFKKWANHDLFYIWSFQTNNTIFTTNQCGKFSCHSSKRCWDSNHNLLNMSRLHNHQTRSPTLAWSILLEVFLLKMDQSRPLFVYFRLFHMIQFNYKLMKAQMVCLGLEPGTAGWKAQTNPLSYGGTRVLFLIFGQSV